MAKKISLERSQWKLVIISWPSASDDKYEYMSGNKYIIMGGYFPAMKGTYRRQV
jgi:hypothetical protein